MSSKAWVLMACPHDESWGPVAVFNSLEEAQRAKRILTCRLHGKPVNNDYPEFNIREVDLNPEIEDTGTRRLFDPGHSDEEPFPVCNPGWDDGFDGHDGVYNTAMNKYGDYVLEDEVKR